MIRANSPARGTLGPPGWSQRPSETVTMRSRVHWQWPAARRTREELQIGSESESCQMERTSQSRFTKTGPPVRDQWRLGPSRVTAAAAGRGAGRARLAGPYKSLLSVSVLK